MNTPSLKFVAAVLTAAAVCCMASCGRTVPETADGKPKYLWIDATANFARMSQRDSVDYYLDKAREAGFNRIVVDVRSVEGEALYRSDIVPPMEESGGLRPERDRDYLQYFIDAAHARGMKVTAGTTLFPVGSPMRRKGPAYYDSDPFAGRTCVEYTPQGMVDIREQSDKVAAFLNPAMPENQEYALSFVREIAERYDIDGYSLDYCRYPDMFGDFSDFSRRDFERYLGTEVERWPEDIFSFDAEGGVVAGRHYRAWWSYRAKVISDFIGRVRDEIKSIRPDTEVVYWAASWIYGMYGTAQNWASPRHAMHRDPYTDVWCDGDYMRAGFADRIDAFMLGAYLERIFGLDDHESIEYSIVRAKNLIKEDCRMYATIYALNHEDNIEDAVYVCLRDSEGLMVFDICQVIGFDLWDDIRRGIERAEPELRSTW